MNACKFSRENNQFKFLYDVNQSIENKLLAVARSYGADGIEIMDEAKT